jgi:cell filamentation protein
VFDPFGDFESRGHLRNTLSVKDLEDIKELEHLNFRANLEPALASLEAVKGPIGYEHFLKVHGILFGDLYPWAGQDRHALGVASLINKGAVQFEMAANIGRAMDHALASGNSVSKMKAAPGYVMGMMAWAHPFLDGNGRTMLLVHVELCHRADFSVDWTQSNKADYLGALTKELNQPGNGALDQYMLVRQRDPVNRVEWHQILQDMPGLSGLDELGDAESYRADDPLAEARYQEAAARRGASPLP